MPGQMQPGWGIGKGGAMAPVLERVTESDEARRVLKCVESLCKRGA
jgi:hypothetical protein